VEVSWTNTASFTTGVFGKIYVSQTAEKKYVSEYLVPKFAGYFSAIAYNVISGLSKGSLILINKNWSKKSGKEKSTVDSCIYIKHILPHFYKHLQEMDQEIRFIRAILIKNGASIHISKWTRAFHTYYEFLHME
jgi:hypothetical protein